ncbi:hypothetical protein L1987_21072 [Smallanthus sonchifolius]|uniref:Uncharacterized protein n=2 Tax=Smallanthus sonchifolius TaxID=185202 RepID=A0ACB9ITL8_9ASTR|nr:hypothetical protein L1987_21071 [Smallanthus sonchifolius]KAI3811351.1 hypothetical protein L1987_21072 [Smallanthus sonchifolius]
MFLAAVNLVSNMTYLPPLILDCCLSQFTQPQSPLPQTSLILSVAANDSVITHFKPYFTFSYSLWLSALPLSSAITNHPNSIDWVRFCTFMIVQISSVLAYVGESRALQVVGDKTLIGSTMKQICI